MTLVVNLVRKVPSAKFIWCWWCNLRCDCHITPTPKCNDPLKIRSNFLKNTLLCPAYKLRYSLGLALLTKWPVFLQNTTGNPKLCARDTFVESKSQAPRVRVSQSHLNFFESESW